MSNLSVRFGELGRREEGLAASEEAVTILRHLAARWPDVYQLDFDQSMVVLDWLRELDDESE